MHFLLTQAEGHETKSNYVDNFCVIYLQEHHRHSLIGMIGLHLTLSCTNHHFT